MRETRIRNHKDTKNTKSTKVFIVIEPQRRRGAEYYWGSGIRGQKTEDRRHERYRLDNLEP